MLELQKKKMMRMKVALFKIIVLKLLQRATIL